MLSQLDKHEEAIQHVLLSIVLLQDEFLTQLLPLARAHPAPARDERLAVLAIAYHNLGVELEFGKRYE